jgi:hypothetical protein
MGKNEPWRIKQGLQRREKEGKKKKIIPSLT